jgi:phage N-6-adenine-methyltransferase
MNDEWQTPPAVFVELNREFRFGTDAAATLDNKLCHAYLGPDNSNPLQRDALDDKAEWGMHGNVWCNPPYSRQAGGLFKWVAKAYNQAIRWKVDVVMLIPPSMATKYMCFCMGVADEIRFFETRLQFIDPSTGKPATNNRGDSCIVIFKGTRKWQPPCRCFYIPDPSRAS